MKISAAIVSCAALAAPIGIAAALALSGAASAAPATSASPSASGPPSTSGSTIASASATPPTRLHGADVPDDPGAAPSASEWAEAPVFSPNVRSTTPGIDSLLKCQVKALHGWIRIGCMHSVGVGLVAGDPKEVSVSSWGPHETTDYAGSIIDPMKIESVAQFPLRRGQAYVVAFLGRASGYNADSPAPGPVFQVGWRVGAADPIVIQTEDDPARLPH